MMFRKNWKKEIFTIPNVLSLFRLALIPVYMDIYLNADLAANGPRDYYLAAAILAVSCLTDMIDGKIARRFNMISNLGKILDPLADKATQFALILCLAVKYPVLRWLTVLFVIKEGFQTIAGCILLHRGKILKGALFTGKICTTVLFVSLIVMVLLPNLSSSTVAIVASIDAAFMILALGDYILAYLGKKDFTQDLTSSEENIDK